MTIKTWQERARSSFRVDLERAMFEEITELRAALEVYKLQFAKDYNESDTDALMRLGIENAELRAKLAELESQEPVAYWVPKAEQFCIPSKDGRPFAKAWEPLYAAPGAKTCA